MASPAGAPADRVEKPEPGSEVDLYIYSMHEKPGWQPRAAGDRLHVPHPGSAVSYEGVLYEVIRVEPAPGQHTYRYCLRKWEDRFVVRRAFEYSQQTARAVTASIEEQRQRHRQHSWLIYLFPITGVLPTPLLQRWQSEWGLPMRGASWASVAFFGFSSAALLPYSLSQHLLPVLPTAGVCFYILLEQVIRVLYLIGSEQAYGSLLVTLIWGLANPRGMTRRKAQHFTAEPDQVRILKDQPWDIEVVSLFRDPVLLGEAPVRYEDQVYQPIGYIQQGKGLDRRYIFRLRKLEDVKRQVRREYRRDRTPAQLAPLIAYEKARDRVHAWSLLCGFLPAARQLEFERKYDYVSGQATERTALLMIAGAALKLAMLTMDRFDYSHLVAVYFVIESLYRLGISRARGEPVGSVFGWLLQPFLKF